MILVTCAADYKGHAIVRQLVSEQHEACCILQPSQYEQKLPSGVPFSTVSAQIDDVPSLRTAMQDVSAVIHALEEDKDFGYRLEEHIAATENLIKAAQEAEVRRFIYLSRLGANRASAYPIFLSPGETEAIVRESGLRYTILQPSLTVGSGDPFTPLLVMLAKFFPFIFPIPESGQARFQPLCVQDLAKCAVATLNRDDLVGQTIPFGGPEHFTFEQLVTEVLEAAGLQRKLIQMRVPFIKWMADLVNMASPHNPAPLWWLDLISVGSTTDLLSIPRHFGFEPHRMSTCLPHLQAKRPWRRDFLRGAIIQR